jgi:SAM-dependent methyltransferase
MKKGLQLAFTKDAFGQEVWAYFRGRESFEVVERDDGFVALSGGPKIYFETFKNWPKHQKLGMKFVSGRVLDIGAGAGRVALYLQKKGFKVTAIDNSPLAIRTCRERGVKNARLLPIEKIGIFKRDSFDTVIMYGNNFGLFGNPGKARHLLKKLHKITTSKGLLIAESTDPHKTKDIAHLEYQRNNKIRGRMPGQLRLRLRFRNYIGNWFDYLLVSKGEMRSILKGSGWKIKRIIDCGKSSYVAILEKVL